MKRNPLFYVAGILLAGFLMYVWSTLSSAQEITRALPESDNTGSIILVVGLGLAGGAAFVRFKRPELWAKLTRQAAQVRGTAEHFIGDASTQLHHFEASRAQPALPANSITPTSPIVQAMVVEQEDQMHAVLNAGASVVYAVAQPQVINGRIV